jgi:integrase
MAINQRAIKIEGYTGLYFLDAHNKFNGAKSVKATELQKKVKAPYAIVVKYYPEPKKIKTFQRYVENDNYTVKRVLDEIQLERDKAQLEKKKPEEKIATLPTVMELLLDYQSYKNNSNEWSYTQRKFVEKHCLVIANKRIDKVTKDDLKKIIDDMTKNKAAERTIQTLKQIFSAIYNYAIKTKRYNVTNVAEYIVLRTFDNAVYFEITDEKYLKLHDAIHNYPELKIKAIFMFLINGRRKGETLKMRWEYIDFENLRYATPSTITKGKKLFVYPLSDDIKVALENLGIKKSGYIFDSDANEDGHVKDIRTHWKRILEVAGIEKMRLHDLRHTIGYRATKAGVPIQSISKVLGHSSIQVTQRYSNTDTDTISSILDKIKPKK